MTLGGAEYTADTSKPLDISIPLVPGKQTPKCFWAPDVIAEPVISGDWIGDTTRGGIVNFKNLSINPHGNGTHTECVGHIAEEKVDVNQVLTKSMMLAEVMTVIPTLTDEGDRVVMPVAVDVGTLQRGIEALVLRTTPNDDSKKDRNYSGTNPVYLSVDLISEIVSAGIKHLLVDTPSVDREEDGGALAGHRAFWDYPATIDKSRTITELIYVDNSIKDGIYLLDLQILNLHLDASPSRPILYSLRPISD